MSLLPIRLGCPGMQYPTLLHRSSNPLHGGRGFFAFPLPLKPSSRFTMIEAKVNSRNENAKVRNRRLRKKFNGSPTNPRLSVFCSTRQLYVMLIDDQNKKTLFYASTLQKSICDDPSCSTVEAAQKVGEELVKACKELKISEISSYDRNGFARGERMMDLGVGSFVVANSLVSRQARNAMSVKWKAALQSICPLVVLGFGRLISTAGVDYQVHVGEYGVHWNFFFTLASVSILTSLVNIHPRYCGIFGALILIGYQICLICGLSDYLTSNERTSDIINQNKEGLFSIFGYWGLYLIGVHLGYHVLFANESSKTGSYHRARVRVWILTTFLWLLTVMFDSYVERVSRRTCNLAYVTFVLAQNFEVLSVFMLSDFISGQNPLVLEEAFNHNLLGSFLLANVLTGIVNLCVDTLSTSSSVALGILFGYTFVLSSAVGFAWFCRIRFKFW